MNTSENRPRRAGAPPTRRILRWAVPALLAAAGPAGAIEAPEIVARVQQQYGSAEDYALEFVQAFHWKLTAVIDTVRGTVYFKQQQAFRFESAEQVYTTDGTWVWNYSTATNQTIIETFDPEDDSFMPRRLLVSIPKSSRSELLGEEAVDGHDCYKLRLTPSQDDLLMREAIVWVDRDAWVMRRLRYVDLNDNVVIYTLQNIRRNTGLPASLFRFDPPPGVEVVDLREDAP